MPGLRTPYATTTANIVLGYAWGTIYDLWGSGADDLDHGSLGVHRRAVELKPRPVHMYGQSPGASAAVWHVPFKKVASNGQTAAWVMNSNYTTFTGRNAHGELGRGNTLDGPIISDPILVGSSPTRGSDVSIGGDPGSPAAGGGGTTFVIGGGTFAAPAVNVYATGWNNHGQMGMGDAAERTSFVIVWSAAIYGATAVRVHCGANHTAILDSMGRVWTAGRNNFGQLGIGSFSTGVTTWTQIAMPSGGRYYTDIACSDDATLLLVNDGTVWGMGNGGVGQLGPGVLGAGGFASSPTEVTGISGVAEMTAQGTISWFRTTDGRLLVYGNNQLAGGMAGTTGSDLFTSATAAPREVNIDWTGTTYPFAPSTPKTVTVAKLAYVCGAGSAPAAFGVPCFAVIGSDGKLYTWGSNAHGQRGDGTTTTTDDRQRIFCSSNGLTNVSGVSVTLASIHVWSADCVATMLHFSPGPLQDCRMLRQLSGGPVDPPGWDDPGFDDSAWVTPVAITPDPRYPDQLSVSAPVPRMQFWDRVETANNVNALVRLWGFVPADDPDVFTGLGIMDLFGQFPTPSGAIHGFDGDSSVGCDLNSGGGFLWINGAVSDEVAWPSGMFVDAYAHVTQGADNLFAMQIPGTRVAHLSTFGGVGFEYLNDVSFWIAATHVVLYFGAVFGGSPGTGVGTSRGRSYAQIVG